MTTLKEIRRIEQPHPEVITVLTVSPFEEDHARLREIFRHSRWRLYSALTWREAREHLQRYDVTLVICEQRCPEGNWRELFDSVDQGSDWVPWVVCGQSPDLGLWAQAVNAGAFDVLSKPFDRYEVLSSVAASWQHYRHAAPSPKQSCPTNLFGMRVAQ